MLRLTSLLTALTLLIAGLPLATPHAVAPAYAQEEPAAPLSEKAIALPRGCIGVTPPGGAEPACCINGVVYIDGAPVAGAEVQVTSARGDQVTVVSQVFLEEGPEPFYRLSLSAEPLRVVAGEQITVRARYGGHERVVTYVVQPGSQIVDVVLPKMASTDYFRARSLVGDRRPGRLHWPVGVDADSAGNVYVANWRGNYISVFDRDGVFLRSWGDTGNLLGQFDQPMGLAVDASNNVYVVDSRNHRIQKFSSTGTWLTSWGSFGSGPGQFDSPRDVAVDNAGNVYVTDYSNNRVQKFTSSGRWLATWGEVPAGQPCPFCLPTGIAVSGEYVYILGWNKIHTYSVDGNSVATWTVGPINIYWPVGTALAADRNGRVYLMRNGMQVEVYGSNGSLLSAWGASDGGVGLMDPVPQGIAIDPDGNVLVTDVVNSRIRKFTSSGALIRNIGSLSATALSSFNSLAIDADGFIYAADSGTSNPNFTLPKGTFSKYTGDGTWLFDAMHLDGTTYPTEPGGVAVDTAGFVYLTKADNRVQKFRSDGTWVMSWGTPGTGPGQFDDPRGIAVDRDGRVYVVDGRNHRVQQFSSDGVWLRSWGGLGAANGQFNEPQAIAIDQAGNVYVGDALNNRVQMFTSSGVWQQSWVCGGSTESCPPTANLAIAPGGDVYGVYSGSIRQLLSGGGVAAATALSGYVTNASALAFSATGELVVSDLNGVQLLRPMMYTRPIATIHWLSRRSLVQGQDSLTAFGSAVDSDGTGNPSSFTYRWYAGATLVGTGPQLTIAASSLPRGTYELRLEAIDDEGEASLASVASIDISPPPQTPWTFMLYLAADTFPDGAELLDAMDTGFGAGLLARLQAQQLRAPNPAVQVVVQIDAYGVGNTRRLVMNDSGSFGEVWRGEKAMDDGDSLSEFIAWAKATKPASAYYLAIASHGNGYQGVAWDDSSDPETPYLSIAEMRRALENASGNGAAPIDIVHLDACSMGLLDVAYELRGQATYLIVSQNVSWSFFLQDRYRTLVAGSQTLPRDLSRNIIRSFAAYAESESVGSGGLESYPYTMAVLDLRRVEPTVKALDALSRELGAYASASSANRAVLSSVRAASQKFDSPVFFELNTFDEYLDLANWAGRLLDAPQITDSSIRERAATLIDTIRGGNPLVVEQVNSGARLRMPPKYGGQPIDLSGANGISIYYPTDQSVSVKTQIWYKYKTNVIFQLTADTMWDEFLRIGNTALPSPSVLEPEPGRPRLALPGITEQSMYLPYVGR